MHDYASLKDKIDSSLYTLTEILKRNLLSDHPYFPFIIINADAQLPSNCNISSKFVYRFDYWHYEVVSFMKYIALVFVLCILLVTTPFDNLFYKNEPFMAHLGWMVVTQRIRSIFLLLFFFFLSGISLIVAAYQKSKTQTLIIDPLSNSYIFYMGHDNLAIGRPSAYGLIDDLGIQLISKSDSIVNYYQLCFYAHNIPSIPITVPTIEYEISEWLLGVMGTNLGINSKAANKTN